MWTVPDWSLSSSRLRSGAMALTLPVSLYGCGREGQRWSLAWKLPPSSMGLVVPSQPTKPRWPCWSKTGQPTAWVLSPTTTDSASAGHGPARAAATMTARKRIRPFLCDDGFAN